MRQDDDHLSCALPELAVDSGPDGAQAPAAVQRWRSWLQALLAPSARTLPPFQIWALLAPTLFYFCCGIWRKALLFALFTLLLAFLPSESAQLQIDLQRFYLIEALRSLRSLAAFVPGAEPFVEMVAGNFVRLGLDSELLADLVLLLPSPLLYLFLGFFFSGRVRAALGLALGAVLLCLAGLYAFPSLDLGVGPALLWLFSLELWPALAALLLYGLLVRHLRLVLVVLAAGSLLACTPFPLIGLMPGPLMALCLGVVAGIQAPEDLARARSKERFWW